MQRTRLVQADVVELERVGERHRRQRRERVPLRHHHDQPVAPVRNHLEILGARRAGDDADVGLPVEDGAHDVVAEALAQVDVDVGVRRQELRSTGGRNLPSAVVLARSPKRSQPYSP